MDQQVAALIPNGDVHPCMHVRVVLCCVCTGQGVQNHRQDVLVDQLDGPGPVGDLVVEVVGQPGPL